MEIELKAKIIEQFVNDYAIGGGIYDEEKVDLFFLYNDLGVPLSQALAYGLIESFTNEGINIINETWFYLCDVAGADPEEEYEDLEDLLLFGEDEL